MEKMENNGMASSHGGQGCPGCMHFGRYCWICKIGRILFRSLVALALIKFIICGCCGGMGGGMKMEKECTMTASGEVCNMVMNNDRRMMFFEKKMAPSMEESMMDDDVVMGTGV